MAGSKFIPDRGLTTRMLLTMSLLGILYVVFIIALILVGMPWWLVALIVVGFALFQYFSSDKVAMFSMGAREVSPEQAPQLHAVVDRLCAMADMPKPKVAIADTDVPNAFAAGHNQRNTVVCATTGLLRRLENQELEAVLAHELSHVAHRDVTVMTIAGFLGIIAGFLTQVGLRFVAFGGGRSNNGPAPAVIALGVVAVSVIVWVLSFLLTRLLSRYRELSADRAAAFLTGRPSSLGSALTKITGDMARIPTRDLRQVEPFNAFFFTPAFSKKQGVSLSQLFATHPPVEQRLEQLAGISRQLGQGA